MNHDQQPESIAIVGMAGRFPQAPDLEQFWQNLRNGVESVSFFKDDEVRWLPIEHRPNLSDPSFVKARAVLERPEWFDAAFFHMNPREADVMDPQHRVFLECAWEALENGSLNPDTYKGLVGVFAGASMNTYLFTNLLTNPGLIEDNGLFPTMLANTGDFVPTRVSYKLNLRGPSLNVQTACSTSLVAVVLACQNLLGYRCDAALAGGVSITFPATRGQRHQEGGILSADGHCRTFDAKATGTVLGDGAGVVLLKRLSDAIADGDTIHAVIKGTALNNDGSVKIGYTAPSSDGQAEAIALAQAEAGVEPESISYIETHGTGTPLGDPIEIAGLTKAFGAKPGAGKFCAVGSVKSNIGHLDVAAGVAGLLKTVLAMKHGAIPPSLHFEKPNPKIDFESGPFYVNHTLRPWERRNGPRRAGVSSFGIGGTNAHCVLEEAPERGPSSPSSRSRQLLVISARTPAALEKATDNLAQFLRSNPEINLADVAYTLQVGRRKFACRRAVVCENVGDAVKVLESRDASRIFTLTSDTPPRPVAFLFPGQGSQQVDMTRELYETEPVFRERVDACRAILQPLLGRDLRSILYPSPENREAAAAELGQTAITQPAMFVVEYAMARLWMSWGIRPHAMLGHSLGEYVAACLAGVFSLENALKLVVVRARLMQSQQPGSMLAVPLSEAELGSLLVDPSLSIAAVNAPQLCVVSGPTSAIETFEQTLAGRSIASKRLATSHAFHSAMMEPMLTDFATELARTPLHAPEIPCIANVTGRWITTAEATSPDYWTRHVRECVRFADGVAEICRDQSPVLLHVGPGATLTQLARQHPAAAHAAIVNSLARAGGKVGDSAAILGAVGQLWTAGVDIDWNAIHGGATRYRIPLPTYPFERKRHWIEPGATSPSTYNVIAATLGAPLAQSSPAAIQSSAASDGGPNAITPPGASVPLAAIFRNLSGIDVAGANATVPFVDLGFDSLFLSRATLAVKEKFGCALSFRQVLNDYPTFEKLAAYLEELRGQSVKGGGSNVVGPTAKATTETSQPATGSRPAATRTVPLTPAQREIWFAAQMSDSVSAAYHESCTVHLTGDFDIAVLEEALQRLVERHDALRTTCDAGGEKQHIAPASTATLDRTDLSTFADEDEKANRLRDVIQNDLQSPFDLSRGPLWRVRLIRTAVDRHTLILVVHHLICDGWSMRLLIGELGEIYSALFTGAPISLRSADQLADYAEETTRAETSHAEQYWLSQFADSIPTLELPTDHPRPAQRTYAGAYASAELSAAGSAAVRRLAAARGCTTFTVLLAAFNALLHRLSGQDDIIVGVPAAAQVLGGHETLVGHCANLLPLRSRLPEEQGFGGFLDVTRRNVLEAYEHWQHPFASLLRKLNVPRDPNRVPLANVTFNVGRLRGSLRFGDTEAQFASNPKAFINFDINFNITETDTAFLLDCYFSSELFDAKTIGGALQRYEKILCAAAASLERPVHRLPLLTDEERRQVLFDWNATAAGYPRDNCMHELFEAQAARTPEATALVDGTQRLTYRELNERANRIARRLRQLGVKPEATVAICSTRSAATIAALLGVLKAGGSYVPLDPAYPADRLTYMLGDSRAGVMITHRSRTAPPPCAPEVAKLDLDDDFSNEPGADLHTHVLPGNLAYIIYTSGSTGRPKGVAIEHRSAVTLLHWARDAFSSEELAGVLAATSLCFDLSIFELFAPLSWGGTVILAENALQLPVLPARDEVRLVNTVPSAVTELLRLDGIPPSVATINLAGEPLPAPLVDRLYALPHVRKVYDLYGPSEDTTYSTWALRELDGPATIGRPLPNTQVYLLDHRLELVPPGTPGELCLAGEGLARGYFNQPELTRQKFVRNPLSDAPAARLYRTGDLARHRADGTIEYLGRMDHQVKIRGFRVELGEIETILRRHPGVRDCVVVAREDGAGSKRLVAYLVPSGQADAETGSLRRVLARELPEHMLPSAFVPLERLPLTPTGKIDRRALPAPEPTTVPEITLVTPRTTTEEVLVQIWRDVLSAERIGVHDNFFELGGHSLLVTQVLARIHETFGVRLPMRRAFDAPTIAQLATAIEDALVEDIRLTETGSGSTDSLALAATK